MTVICLKSHPPFFTATIAQSAGAVEYTDNECPRYDTEQSNGKVPVMLGLCGMRSTLSLPLPLGPHLPRIVAPDRAQSMG